jgi:GNAT superfamily N-acetyltransferase
MLRLFLRHPGLARPVAGLGAAIERAFPGDEPWYLEILGVDPAHQGGGLGPRLLAGVLARADREGRACYLETSRPANVGFYGRLGFAVEREVVLVPGGVPFTMMRRPPARSAAVD